MRKKNGDIGHSKILEAWTPPDGAGDPVGCIATSFTFNPPFFETECLARFLGLESDAEDDALQFLIEQEFRMAKLAGAVVLVDQQHCIGKRSLRWDLLPARLAGRLMHAKVSVLAWANIRRVIIASANLTEDGYRRNQEVFGVVDYYDGAESPRVLLTEVIEFLENLVDASVLDKDGSPAVSRSRSLLERLRQTPSSWGMSPEDSRKMGIRLSPVFSGLDNRSVLSQLSEIWPASTPPCEAWVVSPFFDESGGGALDGPTKALWAILRRRGDAEVAFCVGAEEIPGEERLLLQAPESLLRSQPPGRPSVRTSFHRVLDKDNRLLHTKGIWLEGERHVLYLIGSSNFTTAGLSLSSKGNVEANLAYVSDYEQHEKEARQMERCFPETEPINLTSAQWRETVAAEAESPTEASPLPEAFGRAVYDASIPPPLGRLILRFIGEPSRGWKVVSEEGEVVFSISGWEERGRPETVEIDWPLERPPSGLWVRWPEVGMCSWWPVEVLSPGTLLPPEYLRDLPLEVLIRVLTSSQPLHRILKDEIRPKRETEGRGTESSVIIDPHKKVDVSGFLLQRSRRVAEAIEALCARLAEPTSSEACLYWKINGPVGVKSLAAALQREAKSSEERAFLLTELALALARVKPQMAPGAVPAATVCQRLKDIIIEIRDSIPSGELAQVPHLSQYIQRAFSEIAL